jgi:hypothetical protein
MGWITFTVPNTRQREHHISISRTKSSPDADSIVFFDVSVAACIRFTYKKPRAEPAERCLPASASRPRDEADAAGAVECDGRLSRTRTPLTSAPIALVPLPRTHSTALLGFRPIGLASEATLHGLQPAETNPMFPRQTNRLKASIRCVVLLA